MGGIGFSVSRAQLGSDTLVVGVSGEIDLATAAPFEQELTDAIHDRDPQKVVVDLSDVTFMDSMALNALVRAFELQRTRLATMCLVSNDPRVLTLLEITRLNELLPTYPTREEALAAR